MNFSEDFIQRVKVNNDIVDVISESVKLKRSGKNYFGLCPFHHEDTPSFSVSSEKQIYKCFGCGEAGNVISFVMKTKNLPFVEAMNFLAKRAHIEIEGNTLKNGAKNEAKTKLYKLNVEAARYFYSNLQRNQNIKEYFLNRGVSELTIKRFGLGYSLDSWDSLLKYLKNKGYSELDLLNLGLIIKGKNNRYYDRFRNRIIFPVFDYRGRVIGFGGRVLDNSKPKYLNTPETPLFNKGVNLYGLNFALKNNTDRKFIMVEGYLDCISLHQAGITNTVASLGTALTVNQAKLLKRYADKIIIAYDADAAGQAATVRGLDILRSQGFDVRVLKVSKGKDPDEFIRANGKKAFLKLIDEASPLIDYKLNSAAQGIDFNNNDEVIKYIKNVTNIIVALEPVEKDIYIKKISELTGVKEQAIYDQISGILQNNVKNLHKVNIVNDFGQKLYLEPAYIKAERWLLNFMIKDRETFQKVVSFISKEDLIFDKHKKIYTLIQDNIDFDNSNSIKHIELECDIMGVAKEWINISTLELMEEDIDINKLIKDYVADVKKFKLEETKKKIMEKIKELEAKGLIEESVVYAQELVKIQKDISNL